jgi:hypothetical protein
MLRCEMSSLFYNVSALALDSTAYEAIKLSHYTLELRSKSSKKPPNGFVG